MGGTRCQALEVRIALGSAVPEAGDLRRRLCRAPSGGQECGLMFPVKPSGQGEGSAQTGTPRSQVSRARTPFWGQPLLEQCDLWVEQGPMAISEGLSVAWLSYCGGVVSGTNSPKPRW